MILLPRGFKSTSRLLARTCLAVLVLAGLASAQTSGRPQNSPVPAAVGSAEILQLLNRTINWYHQLAIEQQVVTEADDITFADDNRRVAPQVVQLAFEFARQQAQAAAKQPKSNQAQAASTTASQYQGLAQMDDKADQLVQQSQANLDSLKKKLDASAGSKRKTLESEVAEAQSELALLQARRDTIHGMVEFVNGSSVNGLGASGLRAQIEELARSVPSALNPSTAQPDREASSKASAASIKQGPNGMLALISDLFTLSRKKRDLQSDIKATNDLSQFAKQLRAPLLANLKNAIQTGDQLANQPDSTDPAVLAQQKQQLDALTAQFKQASATLLPLSKQSILLNLYQRNLSNWRDAVGAESRDELKTLAMHLGILLVVLAIVFGIGEIVRKSIFRYVHDGRRRYQFLLLRRILVWIAALAIIVITFASELGSVATFAGLLTAGVVVALQNVILSVAGYFFLIGKYGIRVGDRVQLAGVNGEVVDVGLVRLHLLEMGSAGDSQPSGRVVAFSNSIVFQPTSGLFKQIPGVNFMWHEIELSFSPENDYKAIKQRVTTAVQTGFKEFQERMERKQRQLEASVNSISGIELTPRIRVHYTQSGIEAIVRYPADPQHASEMDDAIMRELLAAVEHEPKLKLLGSAGPRLRADGGVT
ncbi:MAG TPA: mechanosensitive ion channel family protein [Terriglobales bacterium]|jgi:small-conductance mechanosensitive channel